MNILTKIYEKLFVPKDVRKLCQALRDGKLELIGYHYSTRYDSETLNKYATVSLSPSKESNDWIKVWRDGDVNVYKNHSQTEGANLKGYGRLVEVAYGMYLAKRKAARLIQEQNATAAVQGHINEIFADILKG